MEKETNLPSKPRSQQRISERIYVLYDRLRKQFVNYSDDTNLVIVQIVGAVGSRLVLGAEALLGWAINTSEKDSKSEEHKVKILLRKLRFCDLFLTYLLPSLKVPLLPRPT